MKRPETADTFPKGFTLQSAIAEYAKSPLMFEHIKALDHYIDYLEEKILNVQNQNAGDVRSTKEKFNDIANGRD